MSKASDQAYEAIRADIIAGRVEPGAHLPEEHIAQVTGVSRTPVREALRRLNAEHLVTFVPNRGAYVANWSADAVDDIFQLRAVLEGYAAARAAERISDELIERLVECATTIDTATATGGRPDIEAILAANHEFHRVIITATGSERLDRLLASLVELPMILRTLERYSVKDLERSNRHHWELISAFRAHDAQWARSVMTAHLHAAHRIYADDQ
ncbi:MAG: GntR family transcriptional regulator [Gammaproteobacteria bacterium]|nr:GntR family transcriptional regulator [Gammaproteobacteria bacterium]